MTMRTWGLGGLAVAVWACSSATSTSGDADGAANGGDDAHDAGAVTTAGRGGASGAAGGNDAGVAPSAGAGTGGLNTAGETGGRAGTPGTGGAAPATVPPTIAGCVIFPADNPWNRDVSRDPVHGDSAALLGKMNPDKTFHPDWGTVKDNYGLPFSTGTGATPVPLTWTTTWGPRESDKLPCASGTGMFCYPIPLTAPIEGGKKAPPNHNRHVLYLDTAGAPGNCTLYELFNAQNPNGAGWTAANGAIFHMGSNALRPDGWTSADAAGLPILPGLVRLAEVTSGEIRHAIRFTIDSTAQGYIHPATHAAGDDNAALPPMGLRLRLKATFNLAGFSGPVLVVLKAMQKYGIILADNGSDWFISGESNDGWAPLMENLLTGLGKVYGRDFEVVNTGPVSTAGL